MAEENTVFWLGGQPRGGAKPTERLADSEAFVAAIRTACGEAGCDFQRVISALGPYGTWLVEIQRDGKAQRVLWNGKEERLVLQVQLSRGGWEDPLSIKVADHDIDGFAAGVRAILAEDTGIT
jgi:hypothetical protein